MPHIVRTLPSGESAVYAWFEAMHTRVDILLKCTSSHRCLLEALDRLRATVERVEQAGNRFAADSEIAAFNRLPAGEKMRISPLLHDILSRCLRFHTLTSGIFDITVNSAGHTPHTIGALHVADDLSAWKDTSDVNVELSGFLKGYALEMMRPILRDSGIDDALVNMGNSSVMSIGDVPFHVRNGCLTTSGNDSAGRRHIIDPLTGEFIEGKGIVSVVTGDACSGEVLSTSLFIADKAQEEALVGIFSPDAVMRG